VQAADAPIPFAHLHKVEAGDSPAVVAEEAAKVFLNQLCQLLTESGPVHEVWFDGANPSWS
jgi:hypothetical protein